MKIKWLALAILAVIMLNCSTQKQTIHEGILQSLSPRFGCDQIIFTDGFTAFVSNKRDHYQLGAKYLVYRQNGILKIEDSK
jgi:hypothetical protein